MKIKTSELIGPALDWAVAKCDELPLKLDPMSFRSEAPEAVQSGWWVWPGPCAMIIGYTPVSPNDCRGYSPSTDWGQGGPIIERERISGYWDKGNQQWDQVMHEGRFVESGATKLIAAMRCYVASKLGDEVNVPEELT